ncbi:Murein DD-endopeptidase MepM and murein hydrolase activator NlpD, contain LysM domain [Sphingobacterium nematocida]|uniref:Murein DD-endopeptidase MepM and murein hydrolase activator NlpD, contain LysM domain n=1 Tax=Sphingobacterium nematocida TaxID=1513896 RepID=A0A1T5ET71_9SPHI|nr:M23 family metallopeptidase [Sphingobacterium nematocida]SKB87134.1 Murein DD-endopeptidase MepM and murein hydrolase activator NlpD, contain LysM domain [Sphingobacterium nematocida]
MLKKKSSVLICIEGHKDKSLQVPTLIVKHWKNIALSALVLIIASLGSILYLSNKQEKDLNSKYEATLDQVNQKNLQLALKKNETDRDIIEAKKSFNKIDSTLERINEKMKNRGLKTIALQNAGGPIEIDEENIDLLSEYYEEALKDLDKKLSNIPIGIPHNGKVTSKFGYRSNPFTNRGREMHSGVDLKGSTGDPVKATATGKVTFAGYDGDYGYVVKVKHQNGYETRYAHLSKTKVKQGQSIDAGKTIGLLGSTGRSTGPHLHYEILKNDKKINPEKYFKL